MPSYLSCFPGHFPGDPVVPGVLQLDWAMEMCADLCGEEKQIAEIVSLRFLTPIRPQNHFRIHVGVEQEQRMTFRIWNEDNQFTKGRIRLAAAERIDS